MVIMEEGIHKVGEERIKEVVEAREMVMQVEEPCIQVRRSPVMMTRLSVRPF